MWRSQSPSLSARRNRWMIATGKMRQSTQSRPVRDCLTFSSSSSMVSTVVFPAAIRGSSREQTTMRKPLTAFGQAFPFSMWLTPLKATPSNSSKPLPFIRVPMQPMNDMRVCIPPGLTTKCFQRLGYDHFICSITLYNCISADRWIYGRLCCLMNSLMKISVVSTVSGCAGGESINGPKTNCVATPSKSPRFLAALAIAPDHSGPGLGPSVLSRTANIHCMSLSRADFTADAVFATCSNGCPILQVTAGGIGFFGPMKCAFCMDDISLAFMLFTSCFATRGITIPVEGWFRCSEMIKKLKAMNVTKTFKRWFSQVKSKNFIIRGDELHSKNVMNNKYIS